MKYITPVTPAWFNQLEQLKNNIGHQVQIKGTVYKIRPMSGFAFVIIQSNKTLLQGVYGKNFSTFSLCDLKENMSALFTAEVVSDPRSQMGFELRLHSFTALSAPVEEPPVVINNKEIIASLDTLLDYRPLTLRNERQRAIFQLQAGICQGFRHFFDENGFTEIHSPKIVASGAEGGANIFKLNYFQKEAYLTQSPQFYKQMMVGVFERVYEIAPVFRAEKHDTSRHINEYTSIDFEMGFIDSFHDIMALETRLLSGVLSFIKEHYPKELTLLNVSLPVITQIPALSFNEAKTIISDHYRRTIHTHDDFEPEEEKLLCQYIQEQTGSEFVFVTHYKSSKRPFYAMDSPDDPTVTESFDLLFRGMEITTGGQRIHDYHRQTAKMKALNMNIDDFASYLMTHKHGLPPHGGLGLGLERFTAKLLGFQNVRHATLFPRDINRLEP